jgi:hypothetical protein
MFACIASAIGRLKCCGHAAPSTRTVSSRTPAIIAAPRATESPCAHRLMIRG